MPLSLLRMLSRFRLMPGFELSESDFTAGKIDGEQRKLLKKEAFERFNEDVLGLGNLRTPSSPVGAIAAVFDLGGFTRFCNQVDPDLAVPVFMSEFLSWLLTQIRNESMRSETPKALRLWFPLPFFVKYLGDGILVLWKSHEILKPHLYNMVVGTNAICRRYEKFVRTINKTVGYVPTQFRCGLARGSVYSVGQGKDYVGSCINIAARLQKLPGVTCCFNIRGFECEKWPASFKSSFQVKRVAIRGVGTDELVGIRLEDINSMNPEELAHYSDP